MNQANDCGFPSALRLRVCGADEDHSCSSAQEMVAEPSHWMMFFTPIENGNLLEDYPDHRRGACCLLYGTDAAAVTFTSCVLPANPTLSSSTVYLPAAQVDFPDCPERDQR